MARGDKFYFDNFSVRAAIAKRAAKHLALCFEACADACEHVSDCVEFIIMKNT